MVRAVLFAWYRGACDLGEGDGGARSGLCMWLVVGAECVFRYMVEPRVVAPT